MRRWFRFFSFSLYVCCCFFSLRASERKESKSRWAPKTMPRAAHIELIDCFGGLSCFCVPFLWVHSHSALQQIWTYESCIHMMLIPMYVYMMNIVATRARKCRACFFLLVRLLNRTSSMFWKANLVNIFEFFTFLLMKNKKNGENHFVWN